jgi:hypothetical protein
VDFLKKKDGEIRVIRIFVICTHQKLLGLSDQCGQDGRGICQHGETRIANEILVRNLKERRPHGRNRRKWEDTEMHLKEIGRGLDSTGELV